MKTSRRFSIKLPHEANDQTKRVLLQALTLALLAGLIFCGTSNLGALGKPSALSLTFGKTNAHLLALYSMSPSATKITAAIGVGSGPEDMLYDPTNGYIYVANTMSNTVSVINPVTNSVPSTITNFSDPRYLLYDPTNGYIYVADEGTNTVSVINPANNSVTATIGVGYPPYYMIYDSDNGYIYVASRFATEVNGYPVLLPGVSTIDPSTNAIVARVPLTSHLTIPSILIKSIPLFMVCDPTNGYIYVANLFSSAVSVINPVTNSVVGNVTVGAMPMRLLYDPTNGYIYVANSFSGSISVIEASPYKTYTVSFDQSGLPPGTTWSVSLANVMKTSNSNRLEFQVLNGSYQWSVSSPYGYVVNPQSGTLDVRGDNQSVDLIFKPSSSTYALTFSESGLPNGARWSLSVGGNAYATENRNITFRLKPGDYNFSVPPADGYYSVPSFGSIVVSNKPVTLSLLFVPASSPLLPRVTMLPANVSGLTVSVGGSINHSGGFIEKVIWEWGDGKNGTGPFPQSHEYSKPGVYNVTVEVFASNGVMSSSYEIVNVRGTGVSHYIIVGLALASAGVIALTAYKTRFTPKKAEKKNKGSKRKKSNKRRNAVGRPFSAEALSHFLGSSLRSNRVTLASYQR